MIQNNATLLIQSNDSLVLLNSFRQTQQYICILYNIQTSMRRC